MLTLLLLLLFHLGCVTQQLWSGQLEKSVARTWFQNAAAAAAAALFVCICISLRVQVCHGSKLWSGQLETDNCTDSTNIAAAATAAALSALSCQVCHGSKLWSGQLEKAYNIRLVNYFDTQQANYVLNVSI
jgi:hypothetical protein